jgi:hypothetical protein
LAVARAKGASRWVLLHHVARNALLPCLTIAGVLFGELLAGAVVTEAVFGLNGLGTLTQQAVGNQDTAVLQAVVVVSAAAFVLINLAVDLLYPLLDPRLRHSVETGMHDTQRSWRCAPPSLAGHGVAGCCRPQRPGLPRLRIRPCTPMGAGLRLPPLQRARQVPPTWPGLAVLATVRCGPWFRAGLPIRPRRRPGRPAVAGARPALAGHGCAGA